MQFGLEVVLCVLGRRQRVSFLEDRQGRPWTWVMGEHVDDKSVEQLLEEEAQEIARQQAELEAEELRYICGLQVSKKIIIILITDNEAYS